MTDADFRVVAELGTAFYFRAAGPEGPAWLSDGFFAVTGIPQPPPPGWNWIDSIHADDRPAFVEAWAEAQAAGQPFAIAARVAGTDGRDHWYRVRATVVAAAPGSPKAAWVGVAHNLDEERASVTGELVTEFLATASHELRTPLNAIAGWLHVLKLHAHGDLPQWQALTAIERNMAAEKVLIDDLLDVSRLTRGAVTLVPARFDFTDLVRGCVANAALAARAKGIALQVEAPDDPVTITADRLKIEQVVWHLLNNSVRSTSRDGEVQVQVGHNPARAWLRVSDSGERVAGTYLPHIFEPFSQRPRLAAHAGLGLGLGLTLVRALVELHGGSVSAASGEHGQGTVFEVTLPIAA